jgi:PKD repeat protein
VFGNKRIYNTDSHLYDDGMDAFLTRTVDFTGYEWARVDYRYWLESEAGADRFEVVYFTGAWHAAASFDGSSGGWLAGSTEVPLASTGIGFRFVSNDTGRNEGVYIDQVEIIGSVSILTCGAAVAPTTGVEASTPFVFTPTTTGGLRPLTWAWAFGDGKGSTSASPVHFIDEVGTYTPTLTLRDQLGQVCVAEAPTITVDHDVSVISVTPPTAELVEGESMNFSAFDARGHTLDFTLFVTPASCGEVTDEGGTVLLRTSQDSGGLTCIVSAAYGGSVGSAVVVVSHDTSVINVLPPTAVVTERTSVVLSAADRYGHPLAVTWTASCGRVDPGTGATTTFTANTQGGRSCRVTATFGQTSGVSDLSIVQDVSEISVSPSKATIVEGSGVAATVRGRYGDPVDATWTIEPAACGVISPPVGPSTTFTSAVSAGGLVCRVRAAVGGIAELMEVNVAHDWSTGSIEPSTGVVEEGSSFSFGARDANNDAVSVAWTLTPAACGSLAPLEGASTVFTAGEDAGGMACTIIAAGGPLTLRATAAVLHKPPALVQVTVAAIEAGGTAVATAAVFDGNGHALDGATVTWSTDCSGLSATTGTQVAVSAAPSSAGSTCHLTATSGAATKTTDLQVLYARPFKVTVTAAAASTGGGTSQAVQLTVTDAVGNTIDPSAVTWKSTCGQVSGSGMQATFTAPQGGGACTVSAEVSFDGAQSIGGASIAATSSAPSTTVVAGAGVAIAAAAVGALLFMRRRGGRKPEAPEAAAPEAPKL